MPDYFLGVVPPEPFRRRLAALLSRHKLKAPRTTAHITVHAPFDWPAGRAPLDEAVRSACEAAAPFRAELAGAGRFGNRVVFVEVRPREPFIRMHEAVRRALGAFPPERKPFHPHLTFAKRFRTSEQFRRALHALERDGLKAEFDVTELTLFAWTGGAGWLPAASFPLRGRRS